MKMRLLLAIVVLTCTYSAVAQDAGSAAPANQTQGTGSGVAYGRRGGRGEMGMGMMGRAQIGTVTEAAADHFTIKTDAGETYTVHFTADTRIVKQTAGMRGPGRGGEGAGRGGGMGRGYGGGTPPQEIKAADIKVGDVISAAGEMDDTSKTVNARRIALMDPQTVAQIRQMEANFGKTWLSGKVTAINGTKIMLTGALDNAPYTLVADENTEFRRRRDPITLADIQVGDMVRAEGSAKDGVFAATSVSIGGMMGGPNGSGGQLSAPPQ